MEFFKLIILLATLAVTNSTQLLDELPILKKSPSIVWLITEPRKPLTLPCSTVKFSPIVSYSWDKDGNTLNVQSNPNITKSARDGTIVFPAPTDAEVGEYQCFAEWNLRVASTGIIIVKKAYLETLKNKTHRHKVVKGEPYQLDCPVKAVPTATYEWKLKHINSTDLVDVRDNHIVTPNGSIWLFNVSKDIAQDKYSYICLVSSAVVGVREVAAEHYVEVIEGNTNSSSRRLKKLFASTDMVVQTGEVTKLYCIFNGRPLPNTVWWKGDSKVLISTEGRITEMGPRGQILVIKRTRIDDEGTYTCVVRNNASAPKVHHIEVTVVKIPIFLHAPQPVTVVSKAQHVAISFSVAAKPEPLMIWTYNGQPLFEDSNDITLTTLYVDEEPTHAHLVIEKAQKEDTGYYGCLAYNKYGEMYSETLLYVTPRRENVTIPIKN